MQGRASPLAHTCPSGRGQLPRSHLTPASPQFPQLVASFTGLVSPEGWGAIALCILEKTLGKGGDPAHPGPQSSVLPQLSPHGSFSPERGFGGAPTSNLLRPQIPRQPSQPQSSASTPTPWGCSSHKTQRGRVVRVCRGAWRPGLGTLPHVPEATGQLRRRDPFPEPLPHFALKQTHRHASRLWGFSLL